MEFTNLELVAIALGFLIRLGIPIALTAILALALKWLDRRWQSEAQTEAIESAFRARLPLEQRPHCWEIHNCPPSLRNSCQAFAQPETPCWELFKTNGQLKPACRNCKVPPPEIIEGHVFA
jgi:hypothetical protein